MRLLHANLLLLAAVTLHTLDHARQDRGLDAVGTEVMLGGTMVALLAATSLLLTARRHAWAAPFAAGVGAWVALGVTASHFLPEWSALSDPYAGLGLDAWSWIAAGLEVAAALVLATTGLRTARGTVAA